MAGSDPRTLSKMTLNGHRGEDFARHASHSGFLSGVNKFLVPHTGDAICAVCGAALETWSESIPCSHIELIERPDRKPE